MEEKESAEKAVRDIRRKTRQRFSAEEKIRIVIEGLRGEESIASLCRREGIAANLYYRWGKEFLEAGKKRLLGDTQREASVPAPPGLRDQRLDDDPLGCGQVHRTPSLGGQVLATPTGPVHHANLDKEVHAMAKAHPICSSDAVQASVAVTVHQLKGGHHARH